MVRKNVYPAVIAVAAVAQMLSGMPASAHHSVQATVDINTDVRTKATLTKVDWINPHTWMHFDITGADGRIQKNVLIESLGISALRQIGIDSRSALKVGEIYEITYYPYRDGSAGGFMTKMVLPDGRTFETKNTDPTAVSPKLP